MQLRHRGLKIGPGGVLSCVIYGRHLASGPAGHGHNRPHHGGRRGPGGRCVCLRRTASPRSPTPPEIPRLFTCANYIPRRLHGPARQHQKLPPTCCATCIKKKEALSTEPGAITAVGLDFFAVRLKRPCPARNVQSLWYPWVHITYALSGGFLFWRRGGG